MSTYLSKEALEALHEEFDHRRNIVRREIAERILSAKELGDISENFEYQEAKDAQSMNESRMMDIEAMVKDYILVEQHKGGNDIQLGTSFVATSKAGEKTFEIVGSNEADPMKGKISNESPLGQAFIGHEVGDEVEIQVPSGTLVYKITKIL